MSDDSADDRSRLVVERLGGAVWIPGPRRGLAANRNNVALQATGSHLWFLDDDSIPSSACLDRLMSCMGRASRPEQTIITGTVEEHGKLIQPHEQNFLGFQSRPYRATEPLQTVVLPNVIFPRGLFLELRFDESLPAVYEEVDLTTRAVARGYEIILCPDAIASHRPLRQADRYGREIDVARIYVTAKRYAFTDGRRLKAVGYVAAGTVHMVASRIKRGGVTTIGGSAVSFWEVLARLRSYARRRRAGAHY